MCRRNQSVLLVIVVAAFAAALLVMPLELVSPMISDPPPTKVATAIRRRTVSTPTALLLSEHALTAVLRVFCKCVEGASSDFCPLRSDARVCGSTELPPGRVASHTEIAGLLRLGGGTTAAGRSAIADYLRWGMCNNSDAFSMDQWKEGDQLRQSGIVQQVADCAPSFALQSGLSMTCKIEVPPNAAVRRSTEHYLHPETVKGLPSGVSFAQTVYKRWSRAAWLRIDDVCASCESKAQFFMNANRRCHFTLWSIGEKPHDKLAALPRGGRHSIFIDREGAFQYGGSISRSELGKRQFDYLAGTTILNAPLQVDNVGHALHDGHWAFHQVILARRDAKFPLPHRVMMDGDYFNSSGAYVAELNTIVGEALLGSPHVRSPLWDGTSRLLCFQSLAVSGSDRAGTHSGTHSARRWAVVGSLRSIILNSSLKIAPEVSGGLRRRPRVYIYGRNDVHRRSIDNIGALVAAIHDVTSSLSLPDPTLISTFSLSPLAQIKLISDVDVLIAVQGAHLQNTLFMPRDAAILEICPCLARRTSFLQRYGAFMPNHKYKQIEVCRPPINRGVDKYGQNLTLCSWHLQSVAQWAQETLGEMIQRRR